MPDTAIEEMFAEFEAAARDTFRPPGVPEAQRRVRERRRHRHGLLAGLTALLLAGSAGGYAAAHRGDPPEPRPAPTVSPTLSGKLTERKVALPDVQGALTDLRFVDGRTGWALFDTCDSHDPAARGCRRTVARTTDGGATWRRTAPLVAPDGSAQLLPGGEGTLTVATSDHYLVTVDGGASWTSYPLASPPEATRLSMTTPGGLRLGCPSADGMGHGHAVCGQLEVQRLDGSMLPHQPGVELRPNGENALFEGADGRLWLTVVYEDWLIVVTSDDQGETWRRLPTVPGTPRLSISPDGREVWLARTDRPNALLRLVGDKWESGPPMPDDTSDVTPVGDGILLAASRYGGVGFLVGGRYAEIPELRDALRGNPDEQPAVATLPDGTIQILYGETQILGIGRGVERAWVRFS